MDCLTDGHSTPRTCLTWTACSQPSCSHSNPHTMLRSIAATNLTPTLSHCHLEGENEADVPHDAQRLHQCEQHHNRRCIGLVKPAVPHNTAAPCGTSHVHQPSASPPPQAALTQCKPQIRNNNTTQQDAGEAAATGLTCKRRPSFSPSPSCLLFTMHHALSHLPSAIRFTQCICSFGYVKHLAALSAKFIPQRSAANHATASPLMSPSYLQLKHQ